MTQILRNADFILKILVYSVKRCIFFYLRKSALSKASASSAFQLKTNDFMKKTIFTVIFIGIFFCGYAQSEVKPNELTSPIMLDFLKNYQEKNSIQKIEKGIQFTSELSKIGIQGDKYVKSETENIDNMIIVKPNLVEIMRMTIVHPDENINHTMKIINSDINKLKPIK